MVNKLCRSVYAIKRISLQWLKKRNRLLICEIELAQLKSFVNIRVLCFKKKTKIRVLCSKLEFVIKLLYM